MKGAQWRQPSRSLRDHLRTTYLCQFMRFVCPSIRGASLTVIRSSSLHGLEPIQHLCSLGVVVANDLFRVVYRNLVVESRVLFFLMHSLTLVPVVWHPLEIFISLRSNETHDFSMLHVSSRSLKKPSESLRTKVALCISVLFMLVAASCYFLCILTLGPVPCPRTLCADTRCRMYRVHPYSYRP
jgi:hypothetical protein